MLYSAEMSELSLEEIERLAKLARLTLTDSEKEQFAGQLPKIVEFVDTLQNATVGKGDEKPAVAMSSLREDEVSGTRLSLKELEKLAPTWRSDQVAVPAVFEEKANG